MKIQADLIDITSLTLGDYITFNTARSPIRRGMIATGWDEQRVKDLPITALDALIELMSEQIEKTDFASLQYKIELNGVAFGLHPNIDQISTGEYLDLEQCTKNWLHNIPKFMSILYRPITAYLGDTYQIEPYQPIDRTELFKSMRYVDALGCYLFFCNLRNDLMSSLQMSLLNQMRTSLKQLKQA